MANIILVPIIDNGGGLVRANYTACLMDAMCHLVRKYPSLRIEWTRIGYPYPDGAMNIASAEFMASECDKMLVIDGDEIFTPLDVERLLSHDLPLVYGLYPKKRRGVEFAVESLTEVNPFVGNTSILVEVKRAARGFMAVRRDAFEQLQSIAPTYTETQTGSKQFAYWRTLPGGHSEDFSFCDDWRSLGNKVLVDQRILVKHEGVAIYPMEDELEAMNVPLV